MEQPTQQRSWMTILAHACLVLTFLVILAGSVVRASGAGMGCPDWPKCFGQWIPPTDASQLPANYREIYAARGYDTTEFNALKTWTEYVNRLLGATLGLVILATALVSLRVLRSDKKVPLLAFGALFLVGFQGWLGARVVASNLTPTVITVHMAAALLLVAVLVNLSLVTAKGRCNVGALTAGSMVYWMLGVVLLITLLQFFIGTQVREQVDFFSTGVNTDRYSWLARLDTLYLVHRLLSPIVVLSNLLLASVIAKATVARGLVNRLVWALLLLLAVEVVAGAGLAILGLPPVLQPVHLLVAAGIFAVQVALVTACSWARRTSC